MSQESDRARHPAKFSDSIIEAARVVLAEYLEPGEIVLDPMAGSNKIHLLDDTYHTIGVEIEPEWAYQHVHTLRGDARQLTRLFAHKMDAIFTSPAYANRMADQYLGDPKGSRRHTYAISLGRRLTEGNGAALQWGPKYKALHAEIAMQMVAILKSGGVLLLNISDHIRVGKVMPVCDWWCGVLKELGMELVKEIPVGTPRMLHGANHELRVAHEMLFVFLKP